MSAAIASSAGTVYPGDVERVLLEHAAVADAGVVAAADPDGVTVGSAFVVLLPDQSASEEELLAFARARLPVHAVPASVSFIDRLPRSSVGKLLRDELRGRVDGDARD